jgi:tetratricopeptide (TPR) repeat protein
MDLRDASIALIGRLGRLPRRRLSLVLKDRNLTVTHRLSSRSAALILGHGAVSLLRSGRLNDVLGQADQRRLPVLSEHGFLRHLGLMPALGSEPRPHSLRDLAVRAALSVDAARLLALFDIVEDGEGHYSFRDVKAARDFARQLDHREDMAAALQAALNTRRRHNFRRHLAEVPLTGGESQIPFDLGDAAESFDELWQTALDAEATHDFEAAEEAYRRCVAMRPRDAICLLHLADTVALMDRPEEARLLLSRVVAIKPDLADAWFALSVLEEDGGTVKACLERAVAADGDFIDAIHDLAQIHMKDGNYEQALPLWERYLALMPQAPASASDRQAIDRARRALMLCRMARMQSKTNGKQSR